MLYGNRVKLVRETLNKKPEEFAALVGVTRQAVYQLEKSQQKLPQTLLEKLSQQNIDINWLITGQGEMFLGSGETALAKKEDVVYVRKLDIEAAAGDGITNYTDGEVPVWVGLPASFVYPYRPDSIALLKVNGNSMHPSLSHGDVLLVTEDDRTPVSESIYIIGIGDDLRVKRLEKLPNKGLALVSDNIPYGRKEYTQTDLKEKDVRIIARVIKVIKNV